MEKLKEIDRNINHTTLAEFDLLPELRSQGLWNIARYIQDLHDKIKEQEEQLEQTVSTESYDELFNRMGFAVTNFIDAYNTWHSNSSASLEGVDLEPLEKEFHDLFDEWS